jgi:nucleoid DNA-binding protein
MKKTTRKSGALGSIIMYPEKVKLSYLEGEPEKYRLHWKRATTIDDEDITAYAAQMTHVPESAVTLAQEALFETIQLFCINGHAVQVPNLGTFSVHIDSKVVGTAEEADASSVKRCRLHFYPKAKLRAACCLENIRITVDDLLKLKKKSHTHI